MDTGDSGDSGDGGGDAAGDTASDTTGGTAGDTTGARAVGGPAAAAVARRGDDLLAMHRIAVRRGAAQSLLRWLAERTGCWAALVDPAGVVRHPHAGRLAPADAREVLLAVDPTRALADGRRSAAVDIGTSTCVLLSLAADGTALAVVGPRPFPDGLSLPITDAAPLLGLALRVEEAERTRRHVEVAEARGREAVLHLLMGGRVATARQMAGALLPRLPDVARVFIVECDAGRRARVARECAEATGGHAWIVRCPVYARHLIAVVPAGLPGTGDDAAGHAATSGATSSAASGTAARVDSGDLAGDLASGVGTDLAAGLITDLAADVPSGLTTDLATDLAAAITKAVPEAVVAVSDVVPLGGTAVGYEQAFHVLPVARAATERRAVFGAATDPAALVGAPGRAWAQALLGPLLAYVPARLHDPGPAELLDTARSWLTFGNGATRHLRVHRNTVAARVRHIEELLDLELTRVADQSALSLALRTHTLPYFAEPADTPAPASAAPDRAGAAALDSVLGQPAVRVWAERQLAVLHTRRVPSGMATLRAWLGQDARLSATAAALGISVPGARKRLTRIEEVLERSLLQAPSARYDLWLALRALDGPRSGDLWRVPSDRP